MLEVRDRMILLSGKTAENFRKNALHPPVNPERDQLFAELDAMHVVEQTTKKLTIELPEFDVSFLRKKNDEHSSTVPMNAVISKYIIPDMRDEQERNYDVNVPICSHIINRCKELLNPARKNSVCYQYSDKTKDSNQWQTVNTVSDVAA